MLIETEVLVIMRLVTHCIPKIFIGIEIFIRLDRNVGIVRIKTHNHMLHILTNAPWRGKIIAFGLGLGPTNILSIMYQLVKDLCESLDWAH